MEDGTNYWAFFAIAMVFGLVVFSCGMLVYLKIFVGSTVLDRFLPGKPSLAPTYIGAFLMLLAPAHFVLGTENDLLILPYGHLTLACGAIGLIGWLWMPKFLQPKWMKESDRLEARGEDLFAKTYLNGDGPSKFGPRP